MTKKDYILIAEAIVKSYITLYELDNSKKRADSLYTLIDNLCLSLKEDNINFDCQKFILYINKKIATE